MSRNSIIRLSQIEENNWGAEYYHPDKLQSIKKLSKFNNKVSKNFNFIEKTYELINGERRIINLNNVNQGFVNDFSSEQSLSNKKLTKKKDILISRLRPYLKEITMISEKYDNSYVSTEFIILRERNKDLAFFLLPFLFTETVQKIIFWSQQGTNHPRFNSRILMNLDMPKISDDFLAKLKLDITKAYDKYDKSIEFFEQAENLFYDYFDFSMDKISSGESMCSIRKFSETIKNQRLDADFFQEKYDKLMKIMSSKSKIDKLGNLVKMKKGMEVGSEEYIENGIPFLRVSNISKFGMTNNDIKFISREIYDSFKDKYRPKTGEILLSKDATPGMSFIWEDGTDALISSGIMRLKTGEIDENYLSLVLNSLFVKLQIERDSGGSLIVHWRPDMIKETLIPIIPEKQRKEISRLIIDSRKLRNEAFILLSDTIKKVEKIVD